MRPPSRRRPQAEAESMAKAAAEAALMPFRSLAADAAAEARAAKAEAAEAVAKATEAQEAAAEARHAPTRARSPLVVSVGGSALHVGCHHRPVASGGRCAR
eukprot:4696675-Prymnesium_polylepis.1